MKSGYHQAFNINSERKGPASLLTASELQRRSTIFSPNILSILALVLYFILGVGFYCYSEEALSPLNAIYFSVVTLMSIGYGDITVQNRRFGAFFVIIGAGIIGAYVGMLSQNILLEQEGMVRKHFDRVASQMKEVLLMPTHMVGGSEIVQQQDNSIEERDNKIQESGEEDLLALNLKAFDEEVKTIRTNILIDVIAITLIIIIGAGFMMAFEGWTFNDSVYWCCVTMCTVGYGDLYPTTDGGKLFTLVFVIFACSVAMKGFSDIVRYPYLVAAKRSEKEVTEQFCKEVSEDTIKAICSNDFFDRVPGLQRDKSQITRSEFILLVLQMMDKVQDKDILLANTIFSNLDVNKRDVLTESDMQEQMKLAREREIQRQIEKKDEHNALHDFEDQLVNVREVLSNKSQVLLSNMKLSAMNLGNSISHSNSEVEMSEHLSTRRRQSSSSINPLHSIFHSQAPTVEETTSSMGRDDNSNASNINNNDYEHIGYEEP